MNSKARFAGRAIHPGHPGWCVIGSTIPLATSLVARVSTMLAASLGWLVGNLDPVTAPHPRKPKEAPRLAMHC